MLKILLTLSLALFSMSCASNDEVSQLLREIKQAQREADQRASQTLLAYMSLETMFPDPEVRALAKAAGKGRVGKINSWVEKGIDVNSRGTRGATPLFWAMKKRNAKGFKRLLELGADPNVVFDDGGSIMNWAVMNRKEVFLKTALEYGGDPNLVVGPLGETPLFEALGPMRKDRAGLLLDAGADINVQTINGRTPLNIAASLNQYDLVLELLERGADYTHEDNHGYALADIIALSKKTMDPNHELSEWMRKVIRWLGERGVSIPEARY